MQQLAQTLRSLPQDIGSHRREPARLAALSDAELVRATAAVIGRPKRTRVNSFTIHAPLELLARAALLARTPPALRTAVRLRIAAIAANYTPGEEIDEPEPAFPDPAAALGQLQAALGPGAGGGAEAADAAIAFLIPRLTAWELRAALADAAIPCLGLAAHAPILLAALPGATRRWGELNGLLRAPVRALAQEGRLRIGWVDHVPKGPTTGPTTLMEALAGPRHVASPSRSIAPTMLAVEAGGFAARTLARATAHLSLAEARRDLMRIAALAMLQDDPDHAPYGWSHCLTMPQGVLALAAQGTDPRRAIRVAATQVLGFRATLGRVTLEAGGEPPGAPLGMAPDVTALVARAAPHADTHLAKYTLACLDAADHDREARGLYLAAAAHLGAWWDAHPGAGFEG